MDQKPKSRERHCWYCGASMGIIEDRHYQHGDTCGAARCEREAREAERYDRDDAHAALDADRGWSRGDW